MQARLQIRSEDTSLLDLYNYNLSQTMKELRVQYIKKTYRLSKLIDTCQVMSNKKSLVNCE